MTPALRQKRQRTAQPPDFCSGATDRFGCFTEGFSLRRSHLTEEIGQEVGRKDRCVILDFRANSQDGIKRGCGGFWEVFGCGQGSKSLRRPPCQTFTPRRGRAE